MGGNGRSAFGRLARRRIAAASLFLFAAANGAHAEDGAAVSGAAASMRVRLPVSARRPTGSSMLQVSRIGAIPGSRLEYGDTGPAGGLLFGRKFDIGGTLARIEGISAADMHLRASKKLLLRVASIVSSGWVTLTGDAAPFAAAYIRQDVAVGKVVLKFGVARQQGPWLRQLPPRQDRVDHWSGELADREDGLPPSNLLRADAYGEPTLT